MYIGIKIAHRCLFIRDVAARNFLVSGLDGSSQFVVRLSDFGMARELLEKEGQYKMKEGTIPIRWCAPEVLQVGKFSTKSDVYAFGGLVVLCCHDILVLMWEVFTGGGNPWPDKSTKEVSTLVISQEEFLPKLKMPNDMYSLAMKCWSMKPEDRPSFENILKELQKKGGYFQLVTFLTKKENGRAYNISTSS